MTPGHIAMKKIAMTAFMLGILTAPAFAQGKESEPLEILDRDKKMQAEALDRQYKKMMDRNRKEGDAQKSDPWSNMRTPNEGKGK
jgi:hypothetical protein